MERINALRFDTEFDIIAAIADGGVIPAYLLKQKLNLHVELVRINFRAPDNTPAREKPELLEPLRFDPRGLKILLVDDRVKTGSTFAKAREVLRGADIATFCINGSADYPLYDEDCFKFPWKL